jgi:hypothetical protein
VGAFACSLGLNFNPKVCDGVRQSYRTGNAVGRDSILSHASAAPILLDATPAGLVSYLNVKSGKYSAPGVLIPWHSIQYIEYFYASVSSTDRLRIKSARLYLAPGHLVPISEVSILRKANLPFGIDGSRNNGYRLGQHAFSERGNGFWQT